MIVTLSSVESTHGGADLEKGQGAFSLQHFSSKSSFFECMGWSLGSFTESGLHNSPPQFSAEAAWHFPQ